MLYMCVYMYVLIKNMPVKSITGIFILKKGSLYEGPFLVTGIFRYGTPIFLYSYPMYFKFLNFPFNDSNVVCMSLGSKSIPIAHISNTANINEKLVSL